MTDTTAAAASPEASTLPPANTAAVKRGPHPVLLQLAQLYPALFGATVQPLKRGIFQDLLAAHGETLDKAGLKVAMAIHTRSTRYLQAVASGAQRHDLQGNAVEPMAPEHVLHAVLEVFKRRKPRPGETVEEQQQRLQRRIAQLFMDSGLTREAFLERANTKEPKALETITARWTTPPSKMPAPKPCSAPLRPAARPPRPPLPRCTACTPKPLSANWPAPRSCKT